MSRPVWFCETDPAPLVSNLNTAVCLLKRNRDTPFPYPSSPPPLQTPFHTQRDDVMPMLKETGGWRARGGGVMGVGGDVSDYGLDFINSDLTLDPQNQ